ncbi:hypothetical protein DHEL01_v200630 [Diaporthe helianthi]|uniref:AAA+ ATPase domain-containing protein n=1 Tax=Diaporthe helianthi TaxID=158607 RepID=A0A2P5IEP0_DIAHE|nr:hypothetical protein DHEL01_v200630 [Diaporthe helianthi]
MSISQKEASEVPVLDVSAKQNPRQADESPPTDETMSPKNDPAISSSSMPEEQVATQKPVAGSQKATSEPQSQLSHEKPVTKTGGDRPSQYDLELRAMQERLLQLEALTMRRSRDFRSHKPRKGKKTDMVEDDPMEDDKEFRKFVRKAPYGKRWVEKAEARAEATTEERKEFGKAPNKALYPKRPQNDTMYHVSKEGTMLEGDQFDVIFRGDADYGANYGGQFIFGDDSHIRRLHEPNPHQGVRPPSAIRPIYKEPEIHGSKEKLFDNSPLWRIRVPPNEWDTSDTDEWSTDTSTRSKDFNYYRARLRGDFEWELDRLNAQVRRYRMHQEKKQARLLADRAKEENARMEKELEKGSRQYSTHRPSAKPVGRHGMPSLNFVDWYWFKTARRMEAEVSFAIDVLLGEPKTSDTHQGLNVPGETSHIDSKTAAVDLDSTASTRKTESTQDASMKDGTQWNGQGPLPERIRINSKPIMDNLSKVHGKEIFAQKENRASVVILRPFRMLDHYGKEINELSSKLEETALADVAPAVADTATQAPEAAKVTATTTEHENSAGAGPVHATITTQKPLMDPSKEAELRDHLGCLIEFIDEYIGKKTNYLNSVHCEKIVFSHISYLFTPGTVVMSSNGKQAYRVASLRSKRHRVADPWAAYRDSVLKTDKDDDRSDITIKCISVHFDGRNLGPLVTTFGFNKFDGEKDVTSLEIYPLRFHILKEINERRLKSAGDAAVGSREDALESGLQELRARLIERGRLFVSTAGVKHMHYAGVTVDKREEVESQVIIDFEEAYSSESRKQWRPEIGRLVGTVLDPEPSEPSRGCDGPCCWQENVHDDSYVEVKRNLDFMNNMMAEIRETPHRLPSVTIFPRPLKETESEVNALTDDELIIMSRSVPGFVLRDRSWDLDNLLEIKHFSDKNTETADDDDLDEDFHGAFGQLVLPGGHKKMVLSLISQHFRNKESTDNKDEQLDIVRGKGKGLIILLHGAPGVGKTTTAEGVAEVFKKPLFQITCGDLGSSPKEVEAALVTNFALANRWGCILLLDEADVFLAERRREDFNRNGMVAVFLRVLEYYAGILFLTTNRIGDFDEAFASRIHMSLHYPALDEVSTVKVFRLNLNLIKNRLKERVKIEEDEIIAAALKHWREQKDARWNGRQIRNACQTALALAEFDAQPKGQKYNIKEKSSTKINLKLTHLKVVSDAYLEFTEYLKAVHGADAEGRAKESGLRALDTLIDAMSRERARNKDAGGRSSGQEDRSEVNRSPLHGFKLGSESHSYQHTPGAPVPSSSADPRQYDYGHSPYYGVHPHAVQQHPRDVHLAQAPGHNMQFAQGHHAGSQFLGDPQRGPPPAHHHQGLPQGSHFQSPQAYSGGGGQVQGQYQVPSAQGQPPTQQRYPSPQEASYPSAMGPSHSTGPLTPVSTPYHGGGSHGSESQRISGGWTTPDQAGEGHGPGQRF